MARSVLILGALSEIAVETAMLFAKRGDNLCLVARNETKINDLMMRLKESGAGSVSCLTADLNEENAHASLLESAWRLLPETDIALIAFGSLPDQTACEESYEKAYETIRTNFLSVASLVMILTNRFEKQKKGTIAVITSVAGDKGRKSNYVYGSAKGAVSIFLQGVRHRLASSGVGVVDIKPGFVDTRMTAHMKKTRLFTTPAKVARGIVRAIDRKKPVAYLPWFWRPIMCVIRAIPERIFVKTNI